MFTGQIGPGAYATGPCTTGRGTTGGGTTSTDTTGGGTTGTGTSCGGTTSGDVAAQAQAALAGLERSLAERNLSLADLLRMRLFVRDLRELGAIERAIDAYLGCERPVVSIVELSAIADDPRAAVTLNALAAPGAGAVDTGVAVTLDAVAAPGAHRGRRLGRHSVRFGPWVFVGAVSADPASRRGALSRQARIRAQARALFARMDGLLREQGAELRDVVKVGGWLAFPMRAYGPLGEVREELVAAKGLLPASAGVQVARAGAAEELLTFEAIAFAPEDRAARASARADAQTPSRLAGFYADARAAGGHVFTSGEVPDGRGSVREQAAEVYKRLRVHLAAHGAAPADVVQQTVFVRAARNGDALAGDAEVTEAAHAFYGATLPPTTLLPVADLGFIPGCAVEIELVASKRRGALRIE